MHGNNSGSYRPNYKANAGQVSKSFAGGNANSGNNFKRNAKHGSNYLCTHCKIAGHSNERCFKLHGYPSGFKATNNRKVAAGSQVVPDSNNAISENKESATISVDQYNHLIEMLSAQKFQTHSEDPSANVVLAGKTCLITVSLLHNGF